MTREEALDWIKARKEHYELDDNCQLLAEALNMAIETLKQKPRKGHWIYQTSDDYLGELNGYYECSECGRTVGDTVGDIYTEYPYCHCGAKMVKDGKEE